MTTSTPSDTLLHPRAVRVEIDADVLRVAVADGRTISVPIAWFSWLANATDAERRDLTVIGDGAGIWWEKLDEALSVPWLFGVPEDL